MATNTFISNIFASFSVLTIKFLVFQLILLTFTFAHTEHPLQRFMPTSITTTVSSQSVNFPTIDFLNTSHYICYSDTNHCVHSSFNSIYIINVLIDCFIKIALAIILSAFISFYLANSLYSFVLVIIVNKRLAFPTAYFQIMRAFLFGATFGATFVILVVSFLYAFNFFSSVVASTWIFIALNNKIMHALNGNIMLYNRQLLLQTISSSYDRDSVFVFLACLHYWPLDRNIRDAYFIHSTHTLTREQLNFQNICSNAFDIVIIRFKRVNGLQFDDWRNINLSLSDKIQLYTYTLHYYLDFIEDPNDHDRLTRIYESLLDELESDESLVPDTCNVPQSNVVYCPHDEQTTLDIKEYQDDQADFENMVLSMPEESFNEPQMRIPGVPVDVNVNMDENFVVAMQDIRDILEDGITVTHDVKSEAIEKLSDSFKNISSEFSNASITTSVGLDAGVIQDVLSLVFLMGSSFNFYSRPTKINGCILAACVGFAITKHGYISLPDSFFNRTDEIKPQISNSELTDIVTSISMLVCSYVSVNKPGDSLLKNVVNELLNFRKYSDSLERLMKFAITALERIINLIRRSVLGMKSLSFLETGRADLDDFMTRIRDIDDSIHNNSFCYNVANSDMVHSLYQRSVKLLAELPRDKESQNLVSSLNNASSYIFKLKSKMDAMNLNFEGIRQEPASILLRGSPGIGKSQAMEHLCYRMLPHLVPSDKLEQALKTPQHFIHNRQAENVFWEGYDHEKVITQFDDIGQARDIQGNPDNEIMNVIRAINIFENNLHAAEINKKGNLKFVSKMVIANTNMSSMEFNSIIQPEAFFRRWDLIVDVCPKREFCTPETADLDIWKRRLDITRLPFGEDGITSMHPRILEFHSFDYRTKQLDGRVFDFDQIIDFMRERHLLKRDRFLQYKKELDASKNTPQVDWGAFKFKKSRIRFNDDELDCHVQVFLKKFFKNPDYLHLCQMLCADYYKQTGFDHQLAYIVAVYLKSVPGFVNACDWTFEQLAEFLCAEEHTLGEIPVFGIKPEPTIIKVLNDTIDQFYNCFDNFFKTYFPKLDGIKRTLPIIVTTVGTLATMYAIYKSTMASDDTKGNIPEYDSRNKGAKVVYKKPPSMAYAKALNRPQAMLQYDKSNVEILNKVVSRNVYEIYLPRHEDSAGFATFIRGNVFMVNRHFVTICIAGIEDDKSLLEEFMVLKKPNTDISYKIPMTVILDFKVTFTLEDQDVAFLEAPKYVPQHIDIVRYFVSRSEAHRFKDLVFRLIINSHNNYTCWVGKADPCDIVPVVSTELKYTIRTAYRYMAMTKAGDCGSLFTLCSNHSNAKKIMGIHAAGNANGYSYSTALFEEDIIEVLKMFEDQILVDVETENFPQCDMSFEGPQFAPLYKTDLVMTTSGKTSKRRSVLYGKVAPVRTAPAILHPVSRNGVLVDPLQKSLSKYCLNKVVLLDIHVKAVGDQMYDDIKRTSYFKGDFRIYTFDEAILGLEDDEAFGSISRTSSAGYPLNCQIKMPGKSYWFGNAQDYNMDNERVEDLKDRVSNIISDARKGIRHEFIYADCCKDEITTLEKREIVKTRAFSAAPFTLVIAYRMYFGAWVRFMAINKISNGCAVGVNPYSVDWDVIAKNLDQFGKLRNKGAGDYKSFDGSEIPQVHLEILRLINRFYDDDNDLIRFVLWLELINSKHIKHDLVYEWVSSLPSGNPLTTPVNNMVNHFNFRYCWLAANNFDIVCLPQFLDNVYLVVLGDDNVFSVHPQALPIFNLRVIETNMKLLGMVYTSDDKISEIAEMKTIDEITFLKRSFRFSGVLHAYVAPLALFTILEMLNWTTSGPEENTIVETNVCTAILELSLHNKSIYDFYSKKILDACSKCDVPWPKSTSYNANHMTISGKEYNF